MSARDRRRLQALVEAHVDALTRGLRDLRDHAAVLDRWAREIVARIDAGGRVLVAGNGGSAAQAEHFAAELVGRYCGERRPLPALSLSADPAILTALVNDYGGACLFARQVEAHARHGDVLVLLSTSGRSRNLLAAADSAAGLGMLRLGLTGPAPNPLAEMCDDALCAAGATTAAVQELHLIALHSLCECIDDALPVPA